MKNLKRITFSLLGLILAVMVTASILEKFRGTPFVHEYIYGSPVFVMLWAVFAAVSLWYILRRKLYRQFVPFLLHLSFLVILSGAFVTWISGQQGRMDLEYGKQENIFEDKKGNVYEMPFEIRLDDFRMTFYEGTSTPMDYISRFTLIDSTGRKFKKNDGHPLEVKGEVSMNKIFSYRHYRFYQAGYDADGKGSILSVSHDPWGIGLTYTGYALLLLSFLLFFLKPGSMFRQLMKEVKENSNGTEKRLAAVLLLVTMTAASSSYSADAAAKDRPVPEAIPEASAARFGNLYMLYNGRICPVQTFAREFTTKICGKARWRGLSAEQVLTGWMFYYDSWSAEPCIKIKSGEARNVLGIDGKYASLTDYFGKRGNFKIDDVLDSLMTGQLEGDRRGLDEANEKLNIISMVCAGTMVRIFPHSDGEAMHWYAPNGDLPQDLSREEWIFMRKALDYVYEMVLKENWKGVDDMLDKIREYQEKRLGEAAVPTFRFKAEKIYNSINFTKPLAMGLSALGILVFLYFCWCMALRQQPLRPFRIALTVIMGLTCAYLTLVISLRWMVSGHVPLSNGFETMQFLSWVTLLLALVFHSKQTMVLPFGCLLAGLALMVSMMGGTNPQITQLMPVLASPLLSTHVMVIMIAYALLAFTMLNGITAIVLHFSKEDRSEEINHLKTISNLLLYPAVFLLATGIFIGAIWANVSWGRYWGWDPKETWALITMLIYALALHSQSLPCFRKPMFFHVFCVVAFLSVLITYFGVNFFLGGMHSYA